MDNVKQTSTNVNTKFKIGSFWIDRTGTTWEVIAYTSAGHLIVGRKNNADSLSYRTADGSTMRGLPGNFSSGDLIQQYIPPKSKTVYLYLIEYPDTLIHVVSSDQPISNVTSQGKVIGYKVVTITERDVR